MSIFNNENMNIDRDELIKKNIIKSLKSYFKDRLNCTYKYRDTLGIETITLDEYFNKIKDRTLDLEDSLKVRLNKDEINNLLGYLDKLFLVSSNNKIEYVDDGNFLFNLLNMIKLGMELNSEELRTLYKYLFCLEYLKDNLIEKDFTSKFYSKGNDMLQVDDYTSHTFVKYLSDYEGSYVMSYKPIYFIDKLYVLEHKSTEPIIAYDYDIYYYALLKRGMFSKKFSSVSLRDYLEKNNADFLIKDYYISSEELEDILRTLKSFKIFCKLNREYACKCSDMLFNEIIKYQEFNNEQKDVFISIVSDEVLKQLFINNYALIHNEYPDSACLDEASIDNGLRLREGAIALEVTKDDISVTRGYAALKKIYKLNK